MRDHEPHIPGHEHQRARHHDGTCDACWWCETCGPIPCEECPHWSTV